MTVRNVLLVLWGVMVYGDVVSRPQLLGYLITLGAFLMYTYFKNKESADKLAKTTLPVTSVPLMPIPRHQSPVEKLPFISHQEKM